MWWFFLLVGIVVFLGIVYLSKDAWMPVFMGKLGEFMVKTQLGKNREGESCVINDVMVMVDGKSSQIDHIVVNDRGITCIETKNYSGRIYGDDERFEWTQVLAYGRVKNKFYNPVKQNYTHVKRLSENLETDCPIHSLVVFAQSNVKYIRSSHVVGLWDVKKRMREIGEPGTLSPDRIREFTDRIQKLKEEKAVSDAEHVQEIRELKDSIENHICPRCGAELVLKKGKYGEFWGCSNYPRCRFVKKGK